MSERYKSILFFAAGAASFGAVSALATWLYPPRPRVFPSPIETVRDLPRSALQRLPYPPSNFIPGARDVTTPYGLIRVYEWGPENATRKVLLIHGISGSCVVLLSLAETLVARGCRVMLPDLFGRGWSGGPADLPYDGRLYSSQICMCLASSPISWTGGEDGHFSILGYSLGGAIVSNFASWFPGLLDDVILIAPGGLLKNDWKGELLYSGLIPESLMKWVVTKRLGASEAPATPLAESLDPTWTEAEAAGLQTAEKTLSERISGIDGNAVVDWQLQNNAGFVPAFVSSLRFAPIRHQHERWGVIAKHIADRKRSANRASKNFSSGNLLLILGETDSIIRPTEIVPEAIKALGEENLEVKIYAGIGHEVAITKGTEIAELLWSRWNE